MMKTELEENLQKRIKSSLVSGRLPCAVAFEIAEEFKVSPQYVKENADELKIKISACQLGCFP